ncbi:BtrH N-terminal domain-containing protein [Paenibacillus amylolyticus]|uniref:BtrH N-terminal domain-containing protein n=1 Tax=Paenibacillus amylolyticus TaxID=1451 RepID=UPI003242194F
MQKIIEPIEPFNEIYYKSCLYNSLFPVIRHFQRSILPLLINDWAVYETTRTGGGVLCGISHRTNKDLSEALVELGVAAEKERFVGKVVDKIKNSIDMERPVVLWVDCYEIPMRKDTFQKKHFPHTILVHGYDDSTEDFHIIEHLQMENLSYDKKTIGVEALERAYFAFDYKFNQGPMKQDSYYEFYKLNQVNSMALDEAEKYQEMTRTNMNVITAGLEQLLEISELLYGKLMQKTSLSIDYAEQQLDKLNSLILAKQAERYKLELLQIGQEPACAILDGIINEWSIIRAIVAKYVYSNQFKVEQFSQLPDRINNIYNAELNFYENFLLKK